MKEASEYDQEIPQNTQKTKQRHREEQPESNNSHTTPGRQAKKSNKLSLLPIKMIAN